MVPMNFNQILNRGYVLKVKTSSIIFKKEEYYPFLNKDAIWSKYSWRRGIAKFMNSFKENSFLDPYVDENESTMCFEVAYETNHRFLEKYLKEIRAKLIVIRHTYTQTLGGFRTKTAKMYYIVGILFDNMPSKMLFLIKNPDLINEN